MITECGDEYTAANQLVAALLGSLPANMTELRSRLASCESSLVRNALLKTIAGGDYSTEESSLLASAFGVLGIGDCKAAVKELLANPVATKYAKCSMMDAIVQAEGSDFLMMILQEFPQKQMLELMGDHFADALERLVASEEEGPDGIVELLESAPASEQQSAFKSIDAIRQQVGVFAADLYAKGVCHKSLEPLHEGMVAAIVEEGGEHGVQLLTQLRDTTRDPARRRSMQKALLRLGTAAAEPQAKVGESQKGAVYVGSCDGQGAYVILGLHQRHKASSSTLVDLCIRASEDIRDGFTAPRQREAALREALETFGSKDSVGFVRIPWAEAARLVVEAVARTKDAGKEVPADARSAVRIFERVAATEGVGLVPVEEGGVDVPAVPSVDAVRRLLDLPLYDYWFFDTGDLRGVGMLPSPGFGSSTSRWVEQACERLNTPAMQRKLVGMAQHMALWHRYNGDAVHAETMEALARATADDMVQSPLLPVMLEKTQELSSGMSRLSCTPPPSSPGGLGWTPESAEPQLRWAIKHDYFADVSKPTGADLARVDFSEVAYGALDRHVHVLPGDRRPRPTEFLGLAVTIATAYWPHARTLVRDGHDSSDSYAPEAVENDIVTAMVRVSSLSVKDANMIATRLVRDLEGFALRYCAKCRHGCLSQPDADASRGFFSSEHPYASHDSVADPEKGSRGRLQCRQADGKKKSASAQKRKRRKETRKPKRR